MGVLAMKVVRSGENESYRLALCSSVNILTVLI